MTHIAPHDVPDLLLPALALRLDRELEELAGLSATELRYRISLATDHDPQTSDERQRLLLRMLERSLDTHGWMLSWGERGLVLTHDDRRLVLGLPDTVRAFLAQ